MGRVSVQWPLIVARLLDLLPTLDGWSAVQVFDGAAYDPSSNVFATVAHGTDGLQTQAGQFSSQQTPDGYRREETGTVVCQVCSSDDSQVVQPQRLALCGLLGAFEDAIRADRRVGVLSPEGTSWVSADVTSSQSIPGADVTILFTFHYTTVT